MPFGKTLEQLTAEAHAGRPEGEDAKGKAAMTGEYSLIKVFNLSRAPGDLRDSDDLAMLRPNSNLNDSAILALTVGTFEPLQANDGEASREITYTEFRLHRWLEDCGATKGETVLIRWEGEPLPPMG